LAVYPQLKTLAKGRICKLSLHLWGRTSGLPISGGSAADWSLFIFSIKNRP
jgi:hypothetical protein